MLKPEDKKAIAKRNSCKLDEVTSKRIEAGAKVTLTPVKRNSILEHTPISSRPSSNRSQESQHPEIPLKKPPISSGFAAYAEESKHSSKFLVPLKPQSGGISSKHAANNHPTLTSDR